MTRTHSPAEAYLQSVRRQLDAPPEDRERLLGRLSRAVSAYIGENPEAGEEDLAAAFGSPVGCAARLLAECDPAGVAAQRRKKRLRLYAAIAALAALVVVLAALFIFTDATQVKYVDIYITEDAPHIGGSLS